MTQEMLKRFLFQLNDKEKQYRLSPCTTRDIFPGLSDLPSDAALLSSDELKSSEVLSVNRQNRFIEILPHYHDFLEIQYIYSGNCTQIINDREIHLKEGDICIVDTGTVHSIKAAGENDIFVNIMLRKDYYSAGLLNRLSSESIIAEFLVNSISSRHQRQNYLLFHPLDTSKIRFLGNLCSVNTMTNRSVHSKLRNVTWCCFSQNYCAAPSTQKISPHLQIRQEKKSFIY